MPTVTNTSCCSATSIAWVAVVQNAGASGTNQSACSDSTVAEASRSAATQVAQVRAGPVEAAHIEGLAYTKQVIQEAMRLYPPAPIIPRIAAEDVTLGDRQLAKGTPVYIPVYAVHRHQLIWDNPAAFDPDRFAPDKTRQLHRGAYLPFGAGPRICIGAAFAQIEAVAILATLIRSLRFVPVPNHRPMPTTRLTLRPEGGMPMRVERR